MKLIFVFDGKPPDLKADEIEKRQKQRSKAEKDYQEALARGDLKTAWSKAVSTGRLTREMAQEAQELLGYLGIPFIHAPCEGEAQAAFMATKGEVWASASRDFDSLLFGAPRLLRYLTLTGRKRLPKRGTSVPLQPELIELSRVLAEHKLTREQLVDMALLIGTDFNSGVRGIGPKTALKLITEHKSLENLPSDILEKLSPNYPKVRELFLHHPVTEEYSISPTPMDKEGLVRFLCDERGFSRERVLSVVDRLAKAKEPKRQRSLDSWT